MITVSHIVNTKNIKYCTQDSCGVPLLTLELFRKEKRSCLLLDTSPSTDFAKLSVKTQFGSRQRGLQYFMCNQVINVNHVV